MNKIFFQTALLLTAFCINFYIFPSDIRAEVYEIRGYIIGDNGDEAVVDQYLSNALLPCLKRHGVGPIGAFTNAPSDKTGTKTTFVIIPHTDTLAMVQNRELVQSDQQYLGDAAAFFSHGNRDKSYQRISS